MFRGKTSSLQWFPIVLIVCSALLLNGCSRQKLTLDKAEEIIKAKISHVEYQAYISVDKRIGAAAEDPETFLKDLGVIDYAVNRGQNGTWYVTSSLTPKGKKMLKAVDTIWGPRFAAGIAKPKLVQVSGFSLSPDASTAVIDFTLKLEPTGSELAKYLNPEKSVFDNHNIHIECVDVTGVNDVPWDTPRDRPYKVQLRKYKDGWKFEKLLQH